MILKIQKLFVLSLFINGVRLVYEGGGLDRLVHPCCGYPTELIKIYQIFTWSLTQIPYHYSQLVSIVYLGLSITTAHSLGSVDQYIKWQDWQDSISHVYISPAVMP